MEKVPAVFSDYVDKLSAYSVTLVYSEISTEAMTTLMLQGKKKWLIVQSTPSVSGSYALNRDRTINNIWYKSENGEIICSEDILKLQKDTTYQFLITLK